MLLSDSYLKPVHLHKGTANYTTHTFRYFYIIDRSEIYIIYALHHNIELIKYEDKKLWEEIHALIELIWTSERMPEKWCTAIRGCRH
jgi:hypothetical protein